MCVNVCVCMCVCVCVYVCVCMYIYACVPVCMYVSMSLEKDRRTDGQTCILVAHIVCMYYLHSM